MIRIGKPKSDQRLPLGPGAFLIYREATSIDRESALFAAREFFKSVRAGAKSLADFGFDLGEIKSLDDDPALSGGVSSVVYLVELCMRCISRWEGVGNESGALLPLSRKNLAALFSDQAFYELVSAALTTRLVTLDHEGNVSAPSPNGAGAGALPTADPAAN